MRTVLSRYLLGMGAAMALIVSCGPAQPPLAQPVAAHQRGAIEALSERGGSWMLREAKNARRPYTGGEAADPRSSGSGYTIVHKFQGGSDGANPVAGLTLADGKPYGVTSRGGGTGCGYYGCGTIFEISSGKTTIVHRFSYDSGTNVGLPEATLLLYRGKLYGTTVGIGDYFYGAVFSFGLAGKFEIVHKFAGGHNGQTPITPVAALNRELYGTATAPISGGAVYELSRSGQYHTLFLFKGKKGGSSPSGLIAYRGELYGVTFSGGYTEYGTIFKVTIGGKMTILYQFKYHPDGSGPLAPLLLYKGKMYGTTIEGGTYYRGTVFEFDPVSRRERVLHSFSGMGSDGANPQANLIEWKGNLYGTTPVGGGGGTVFKISLDGTETILHTFTGSADGYDSVAPLVEFGGKLYGTTEYGGVGPGGGDGVLFSVNP